MKLAEMNTDQLADLYVNIAPAIERITSGAHWDEIAASASGELTVKKMMTVVLPLLLKHNRQDVFAIIGAVNGIDAGDVARQPFAKTLAQARELLTMDIGDFFSPSVSEAQTA